MAYVCWSTANSLARWRRNQVRCLMDIAISSDLVKYNGDFEKPNHSPFSKSHFGNGSNINGRDLLGSWHLSLSCDSFIGLPVWTALQVSRSFHTRWAITEFSIYICFAFLKFHCSALAFLQKFLSLYWDLCWLQVCWHVWVQFETFRSIMNL